jgi:hypothetical protein
VAPLCSAFSLARVCSLADGAGADGEAAAAAVLAVAVLAEAVLAEAVVAAEGLAASAEAGSAAAEPEEAGKAAFSYLPVALRSIEKSPAVSLKPSVSRDES